MAVHSTQLGHDAVLSSSTVTLYTTPANKRTIMKSVVCKNLHNAANFVAITFTNTSGDLGYYVLYMAASGSQGDSVDWTPWVVLNAGDKIEAIAQSGNVGIIVSGAELSL